MKKRRTKEFKRKLLMQRLAGIALILMSILLVVIANKGTTVVERDLTALLFTVPLALACLLAKKPFIQ